ncbi:MAG: porin family protein [Flavobacteriales bacterium]
MRSILLIAFLATSSFMHGQVLISLLLGDKLNSDKLEFGLDGGANFTTLDGVQDANTAIGFHLGFYFDFKVSGSWFLHTGVIVKSPLGAKELVPYELGDLNLDTVFEGGDVQRRLEYFNVPLMMKYKFSNDLYAEGGAMLGLLHTAKDEFTNEVDKPKDISYKRDIKEQYSSLDAGLLVGVGYRLMKGNGMNIGVRGYYGLVDISKGSEVYNRALYLTVGIPIGKGKATQASE